MAKKRSKGTDRTRQAAVRAAAQTNRVRSDLLRVGARLAALDVERRSVLDERDKLVQQLLLLGVPMAQAARLAGTSRQALMKRNTPTKGE